MIRRFRKKRSDNGTEEISSLQVKARPIYSLQTALSTSKYRVCYQNFERSPDSVSRTSWPDTQGIAQTRLALPSTNPTRNGCNNIQWITTSSGTPILHDTELTRLFPQVSFWRVQMMLFWGLHFLIVASVCTTEGGCAGDNDSAYWHSPVFTLAGIGLTAVVDELL